MPANSPIKRFILKIVFRWKFPKFIFGTRDISILILLKSSLRIWVPWPVRLQFDSLSQIGQTWSPKCDNSVMGYRHIVQQRHIGTQTHIIGLSKTTS